MVTSDKSTDILQEKVQQMDTIRLQKTDGPVPALRYLLAEWPELKRCTHQHLGDLLELARETISRNYWEAL